MHDDQPLTAMLIPFYLGDQPDSQGRMISQIWAWDFEALECVHDYIQWLFPLAEKSAFNPEAPVANAEVTQTFRSDPRLRQNLQRSLTVMLQFYGLKRDEDEAGQIIIDQSDDYPNRKREWVCLFDHNYLRITRILKCLVMFELKDDANAFYRCLQKIYREDSDQIGGETFQYWTTAARD